jgi:choline dehydrogenase-like flavoprotein
MNIGSSSQSTDFALDVLGRYVCNTFDEALANSDANYRANAKDINGNSLPPRGDMRPFDFIIIGGGTFGSAVAEHLLFRSTGRSERILVLEAGPLLLAEHMQNLPNLGLGNEVWGQPWNGNISFSGLAYCIGGRSLWWGGWSPRLLKEETEEAWPKKVLDDLNAAKLPHGANGYFRQASQQIGVTATNDYIFGALHNAMREQLFVALNAGKISNAMKLGSLPDAPPVEILDAPPTLEELAAMLGVELPIPLPTTPVDLKKLEDELRNNLKLEAPLAVQARPEHAGFFPLNKFSSVPLLIKATRSAYVESLNDDVRKRFMVVPRCHVRRLNVVNESDGRRVNEIITERGPIPLSPDCKVIIAQGTIESTRLALLSFGTDGLIGQNLMAHLRSNIDIRVPRDAFSTLTPSVKSLQTSALFVKGQHKFEDGTLGYFHFQITATGLDNININSEAELFQKIPDIENLNNHLFATDSHVVITIRGIGEMQPNNPNNNITLDQNPNQIDYNERKAYVNLFPTLKDMQLWDVMDKASDDLAVAFANGKKIAVIIRNKNMVKATDVDASSLSTILPYQIPDPLNPSKKINNPERRDGLGTTHHEVGTLHMGEDSTKSVTDVNCRFHGVKNAYVASPALFPTIGSPNPMLTGIALARRLGDHLLPPPGTKKDADFTYLFDGTQKSDEFFAKWLMAEMPGGGNAFKIVGQSLVARPKNGIGLLYYAVEQFDNFVLRLDFCLPHPRGTNNNNSGVFVRFRDPRKPVLAGTPGPDIPGNTATVAVDTGYEIQIDEEARGDSRKKEPDGRPEQDGHFYNRTGAIYKVQNSGTAKGQQDYTNNQQLGAGIWHTYEIRIMDRSYEVLLNKKPSTTFTADPSDPNEQFRGRKKSEDPDSGFIGLQVHTGTVAFANIRIKKI